MSSGGVTYDGVASAQGGSIFRGMSFWVSHRVPQRSTMVDKIRASFSSLNAGALEPTTDRWAE